MTGASENIVEDVLYWSICYFMQPFDKLHDVEIQVRLHSSDEIVVY